MAEKKSNKNDIELNGHMKNLKYFRCHRGYTIRNTAKELGVHEKMYIKWENLRCDPDIPTMIKIADNLHVSIDVLVGRQVGKYEYQKEISNLIFGLNTQYELVQHELEQFDKCCFEVGNLRVSIQAREVVTEDKDLPEEEEVREVLKKNENKDRREVKALIEEGIITKEDAKKPRKKS